MWPVTGMAANTSALTRLLVTERARLLRYLGRYLDAASAEDTLQSMYFKVAAVPGEPPILDPKRYLYRLAHNHAVDRGRQEARQRRLAEAAASLLEDADPQDVDDLIQARADLARVAAAARALPEPARSMFRMNRFDGLSQREIASRLGVSTTTVEKHIRRALATLDAARGGGREHVHDG